MTVLREPDEVLVVEKPESQTLVVEKSNTITVENQTSSTAVTSETGYLVQTQEFGYPVVSGGVQGPRGIPGASTQYETHVAGIILGGNRAVTVDASGALVYPNTATTTSFVVGITTGSAVVGAEVAVQIAGTMTEASWNWTPGEPVFVGIAGVLTQTVPITGQILKVGVATTPTKIFIDKDFAVYTA